MPIVHRFVPPTLFECARMAHHRVMEATVIGESRRLAPVPASAKD